MKVVSAVARWFNRDRRAGPRLSLVPLVFLVALLFSAWSLWIAATTIEDCDEGTWKVFPPGWECGADG